jgi:uncharacterized membrane protein YciS (DUF1049 family)
MTAQDASLTHHPAPQRDRVARVESAFGLIGGPLAWFVQLCAGYALASWPCFPRQERTLAPLLGYGWTWPAMVIALVAGVAIALAALMVSTRIYRRTQNESGTSHRQLIATGAGRTRFLALWGMLLGAGFALTTLLTAIAFMVLPRCAG